jgi:hypothetical protein
MLKDGVCHLFICDVYRRMDPMSKSLDNNYNEEIETLLEKIRTNCTLLHQLHRERYLYLKGSLKIYRVPIIIISSISSILSLSQNFLEQQTISLLNMALSLTVSIIGSIELFFQVSNQIIKEHDTSKDYHILAMNIFKCLSMKRCDRPQNGITFLENTYGTYIKLTESSNILKHQIEDKLCDIPIPPYLEQQNMNREREWERYRMIDSDNEFNINVLDLKELGSNKSLPNELLTSRQSVTSRIEENTPRTNTPRTPRILHSPYSTQAKPQVVEEMKEEETEIPI